MPPQVTESASPLSSGQYPLRTDFMVVSKTGIDGAPKHWPSPGFPPLLSAQFPRSTPDADIADDIRQRLGSGKAVLDPSTELSAAQSPILSKLLENAFGIPAEPRVSIPDWDNIAISAVARPDFSKGAFANIGSYATALSGWEEAKRWKNVWQSANKAKDILQLDEAALSRGSVIYRRLCLQCHGLTGAGDGAQAIALAAMPRDYRQGIFKFITAYSTPGPEKRLLNPGGKPLREDFKRTIHNGLDGSMMPAFSNIPQRDLDDLVSYVIHLSIRGETEFATISRATQPTADDPDFVGLELKWLFVQNYLSVLDNWALAARSPIPIPPEYAATNDERLLSAIRGYKFYNSAEFGCGACHINFGREPALKWDLWGTVVQPRNLVLGVYRGGRRGQDLYARIYGGIYPSGMNAFHDKLKTGPSYPDQPNKIWNIVHFLEALGDPTTRQRLKDPAILERFKEQLKAEGDLFLEDLSAVKIDP
jgi:mono/diheme cytochrome c family protein